MEANLKFQGVFHGWRTWVGMGMVAALIMVSGCATSNWFRPVSTERAPAKIFCGADGPQATSVVVAVYVDQPVEDATFTVLPILGSGEILDKGYRRRDGVNLPGKVASCVRVPLPNSLVDVRLYNVAVHGHSGSSELLGGEIACEPQPVNQLVCDVL